MECDDWVRDLRVRKQDLWPRQRGTEPPREACGRKKAQVQDGVVSIQRKKPKTQKQPMILARPKQVIDLTLEDDEVI
jgi:hypothetical protein